MNYKDLEKTAEQLKKLFDIVLKISTNDYRVEVTDRNGGMVDVYFRDDIESRTDVTIALQTVEIFVSDAWRIAYHWCSGKHEQFNGRVSA